MEKMVCNIRKERDKARPSKWSWNSQNAKGREEVCSTENKQSLIQKTDSVESTW